MTEIREYRKATRCERGGRLLRCRRPIAGQCQYCALGFCNRHGLLRDDGQQICSASTCQLKIRDVEAHLIFKTAAAQHNVEGRCGMPDCDAPHIHDCERCQRRFCLPHLVQAVVTVVRGTERAIEAVRMCHHCHQRLALWTDN